MTLAGPRGVGASRSDDGAEADGFGSATTGSEDTASDGTRSEGAGENGVRIGGIETLLSERLGETAGGRDLVILVDGLGAEQLDAYGAYARTLRGLRAAPSAEAEIRTTVAPSTTAAVLASLGTGVLPGRHGLLGYEVLDPATGVLVNHLRWPHVVKPREWQVLPTVFETSSRPCRHVGPASFGDSGLTRCAFRGAEFTPHGTHDRVQRTVMAVRSAPRNALVYLHISDVDHAGHHDGPGSAAYLTALEAVDSEIRALLAGVPTGTRVTVTADHGMIAPDRAQQVDLARLDPHGGAGSPGADLVLGGEERFGHLYALRRADRAPVELATDEWREALAGTADVLTREEAIAQGIFGPVEPRNRARIGDLVLIASGRAGVVDSRHHSAGAMAMPGVHGSLTTAELLVPVITTIT